MNDGNIAQQVPDAEYLEWINRHVWLDGCELRTERKQAEEEGRDLSSVEGEFARLLAVPPPDESWHQHLGGGRDRAWQEAAGRLVDRVQTLPLRRDYPYVEPSDLAGIRASRPAAVDVPAWHGTREQLLRQLHGGLLGRICGCMLGKPVEGWDRRSIRVNAQATGNWPLAGYWRIPTPAEQAAIDSQAPRRTINPKWTGVLADGIDGMVEDDDTNYTTVGFAVVKSKGVNFRPLDVAAFWCANIPIFHTCTAERVAYRNFVACILPPASASVRNPYREWIGAQIRADYFGYANPAKPQRAAEWAWRDACISHVRNGIYGEMWVAAMLAAAYTVRDWARVIAAGLAQIPARCRLAEDVGKVIDAHRRGMAWEDVVDMIHRQWDETDHHDWCHTNSNAQVVTAGLLYGEDDYEKTIARAVMAGFDTDCNGATCGSLWGVMHGVDALPGKWTAPMRDRIRTGVDKYHDVAISALAADMAQTALANAD